MFYQEISKVFEKFQHKSRVATCLMHLWMVMSLVLHPMVYISQLIRFAGTSSHVSGFNYRKILSANLLKQCTVIINYVENFYAVILK